MHILRSTSKLYVIQTNSGIRICINQLCVYTLLVNDKKQNKTGFKGFLCVRCVFREADDGTERESQRFS